MEGDMRSGSLGRRIMPLSLTIDSSVKLDSRASSKDETKTSTACRIWLHHPRSAQKENYWSYQRESGRNHWQSSLQATPQRCTTRTRRRLSWESSMMHLHDQRDPHLMTASIQDPSLAIHIRPPHTVPPALNSTRWWYGEGLLDGVCKQTW